MKTGSEDLGQTLREAMLDKGIGVGHNQLENGGGQTSCAPTHTGRERVK